MPNNDSTLSDLEADYLVDKLAGRLQSVLDFALLEAEVSQDPNNRWFDVKVRFCSEKSLELFNEHFAHNKGQREEDLSEYIARRLKEQDANKS